MRARRKLQRLLQTECLERRWLMVADLAAAVELRLEVVDSQGHVTNRVQPGEAFTLRAYATDKLQQGGVFAANLDVTFNQDRVEPTGALQHDMQLPNRHRGTLSTGRIDEAGSVGGLDSVPSDSLSNVKLWELDFIAKTQGEVIFAANPADDIASEVLVWGLNHALKPDEVDYGFARLFIGNATPNPLTNASNPADVNHDGEISTVDVDLIKQWISEGRSSQVATGNNPQLLSPDVDADGTVSQRDWELVSESIAPPSDPVDPPKEEPDIDVEGLELLGGIRLTNMRTGLTQSSVQEGDVVKLEALFSLDSKPESLVRMFAVLRGQPEAQQVFDFDTTYLTRTVRDSAVFVAAQPGQARFVVSTTVIANKPGDARIGLSSLYLSPTEGNAPQTVTLKIDAATNRPIATPQSRALPDWETVGDPFASGLFEYGVPIARFDATHGVLSGQTAPNSERRALLARAPRTGEVRLQADGSFQYLPSVEFKQHDSFEYVVMDSSGTSTPQTVELTGDLPALLKVSVAFTDSSGQPITRVKRGEMFYIDVNVSGAGYALMSKSSTDFPGGLNINLTGNSLALIQRGDSIANHDFDRELVILTTDDDGKLGLGSRTATTTMAVGEAGIVVRSEGLTLSDVRWQSQNLIRLPVSASTVGTLQLSASDVGMEHLPANLLEAAVANLEVTESAVRHNQTRELDVNDDGLITAIDALLGINAINTGTSESESEYFLDTDGDGIHAPLDVLMVINFLNTHGSGQAEGERGTASSAQSASAAPLPELAVWDEQLNPTNPRKRYPGN